MQLIRLQTNHPSYFNRIFGKETDFTPSAQAINKPKIDQGVKYYLDDTYVSELEVNFNPRDGVNTFIEIPNNNPDVKWNEFTHCTVFTNDDVPSFLSSWYVDNVRFIRGGIVRLDLIRDIFNDYYNDIVTSSYFIERANLDVNNPLIMNSEGITFNQIKTSETPIKLSNCGWIVGYMARNRENATSLSNEQVDSNTPVITFSSWEDLSYYDFLDFDESNLKTFNIPKYNGAYMVANFRSNNSAPLQGGRYCFPFWNGQEVNAVYDDGNNTHQINTFSKQAYKEFTNEKYVYQNIPNSNYLNFYATISTTGYNNLKGLSANFDDIIISNLVDNEEIPDQSICDEAITHNGYIIHIASDNSFWKVRTVGGSGDIGLDVYNRIKYYSNVNRYLDIANAVTTNIRSAFYSDYSNIMPYLEEKTFATETTFEDMFQLGYKTREINVEFTKVAVDVYSTSIPKSADLPHTPEHPYDVFMIPYGQGSTFYYNSTELTVNNSVVIDCVNKLIREMGTTLYDVQLLPFSPIGLIDKIPNLDNLSLTDYSFITDSGNNKIGFIYYPSETSFRRTILLDDPIVNPTNRVEFKVNNECDVYRIVSPNYGGSFEFSATKNGGISGFEINCTLKPIQPYIHINPIWGGLYGRDFNDSRGLVCSGDFSLSMSSDSWINYKIQNKNYQLAFDRQIEHMEIEYKYQNIQSAIGGTTSAIATGAMAGMAFGPIGAAVGAAASAIGAGADLAIQKKLQKEQIGYSTDMFNYNLQNIQALPYTLNKISSFDINSKIFPFLEYYTCTDEEKQAFRENIRLRGMTVNRFDTLNLYIENDFTYIKAKLVRLSNTEIPNAVANQIAFEMEKGVYLK